MRKTINKLNVGDVLYTDVHVQNKDVQGYTSVLLPAGRQLKDRDIELLRLFDIKKVQVCTTAKQYAKVSNIDYIRMQNSIKLKSTAINFVHQIIITDLFVKETLDKFDNATRRHSLNVGVLMALQYGSKLSYINGFQRNMVKGALLHDIGKLKIPKDILLSEQKLSDSQYAIMQMHTVMGYEELMGRGYPEPVCRMALEHHERMDGSGYPYKKSGNTISYPARLMAIIDSFETAVSERNYKQAKEHAAVRSEILSMNDKYHDKIAERFFAEVNMYYIGDILYSPTETMQVIGYTLNHELVLSNLTTGLVMLKKYDELDDIQITSINLYEGVIKQ